MKLTDSELQYLIFITQNDLETLAQMDDAPSVYDRAIAKGLLPILKRELNAVSKEGVETSQDAD